MKMEQTECSETSAYKIQTPGNYSEENIQQWNLEDIHRNFSCSAGNFIGREGKQESRRN
jgi:hypothetical protein